MVITWYGQSCFKIQTKTDGSEKTVIIDPFTYDFVGLHPPRSKADVVLVSHQHEDHNNIKPYESAFLIFGPGEYDWQGISVRGVVAWHDAKKISPVTIFRIESEEMALCHLSDLGQEELTDEQLERLGNIDILFVPIGGTYTIDALGAQKVIGQIEPRIVIPMHYKVPGLKIDLQSQDKFLKVMGETKAESQDKLTVKKKDLPGQEETKLVVLKAGT